VSDGTYYSLDPAHTNPARLKKEREKAKKLKASPWWKALIHKGVCHYCERPVGAAQLTMDHIVPLARGGTSTKSNLVPSCHACNQEKKLKTPVEKLLEQIAAEKKS